MKTCKHCGIPFNSPRPLQAVCSPVCAYRHVKEQKKAEIATTRARKQALKTIPQLIKEADHAFAAYIRERDRQAGFFCISSGKPLDWTGNQTDAGHFRSRGAASHLRFHEDNCHAQSKHDNRYLSGNISAYRVGLIDRIGLARVESLESSNAPHKWSREELITVREYYKTKLKALQAERTE